MTIPFHSISDNLEASDRIPQSGLSLDETREQKRAPGVSSFMDRSFEQIRTEVLELDPESQRRLAEEIEEQLFESEPEVDAAWSEEIKRRIEKHDRGEATYVTAEESLAKGRAMIEEYKRNHP